MEDFFRHLFSGNRKEKMSSDEFSDPEGDYEEAYEQYEERTKEKDERRFYDSSDEVSSDEEPPTYPKPNNRKPKIIYSGDIDSNKDQIKMISDFEETDSFLKVRNIKWNVPIMTYSVEPKHKMFFKSSVFVSGYYNQFQVFFIMERFHHNGKDQFGVYACELKNDGNSFYEAMVERYKLGKHRLEKKNSFCPKKENFQFLGCLENLVDGSEWDPYYVDEDCRLKLRFKVNVCGKSSKTFLLYKKLMRENQKKDVVVVLSKKDRFSANKKILSEKSSVFGQILSKNPNSKIIKLSSIDPEVLKQVLLFIHTGKVSKLFEYLNELYSAAKKYKLEELEAMCKKVRDANFPDPKELKSDSDNESDSNDESDSDDESDSGDKSDSDNSDSDETD